MTSRSLLFLTLLLMIVLICCTGEDKIGPPASVNIMISSHTSGVISRESVIQIQFVENIVDSSYLDAPLKDSPFVFSPKVKGIALWKTPRLLQFQPQDKLPAGKDFQVSINLAELMEVPRGQEEYSFNFSTLKQSFDIQLLGLKATGPEKLREQQLSGIITTADAEDGVDIEKMINARQEDRDLPSIWEHSENRRDHTFIFSGIERQDESSMVSIRWNGDPIGVDRKGEQDIEVPPITAFTVMNVRPVQEATGYIEIRFADPLDKKQKLDGLIQVDGKEDLRFTIDQNIVQVYSAEGWAGEANIKIQPGIRNSMGIALRNAGEFTITFAEIKPQVRFASKGVILPTTQGLTLPIETVNLKAVIVQVTKVFENNIPQFLQMNALNESSEIRRVGRIVWRKEIPLDLTPDRKNRWVRYGLDLSPLLKNNLYGLYQIQLSFKRWHIDYYCSESSDRTEEETAEEPIDNWEEETESSYWDYYDEIGDNWYEYYQNRLNPCHPAYYLRYGDHDIMVKQNVMISDIGLIAKMGSDHELLVVATDLKTAEPLPGASIQVLDYQQQQRASGQTDSEGQLRVTLDRQPFFVVCRSENQAGYLRLESGESLSVSHFDAGGSAVKEGIKGFIYGERGIWRPGDDIHVAFILFDSNQRLPSNHPIILEFRNPRGQLVERLKKVQSLNGFYYFPLRTEPDAPTGKWNVKILVGGMVFEKQVRIETVIPNRLKVELAFDGNLQTINSGPVQGTITSTWLHAAPARQLKADIELELTSAVTRFEKYPAFDFDDPVRVYEPENIKIFDGRLDESGKARFQTVIRAENLSPGMLNATFNSRVFEASGAFSVDRLTIPFHPYQTYIGIHTPAGDKTRGMLLTDTTHTVQFAAVTSEGQPVPTGTVEIKMYKINWRWWWEKGPESLADYIGTKSYQPVLEDTIMIRNGGASWQFEIKYPSWGRYLIRARHLEGNHITGKILYIDWPGWASRQQKDMPEGATVLSFTSDKEEYKVGETVTLTIPASSLARGLVSIESGTKVIKTDWIQPRENTAHYQFTATGAMAPNVYVNITLLQPHLNAGNDLPIRMYGIIPVKVYDARTRLHPQFNVAEVLLPENKAEVTVSEQDGRPMTYTLAVVDEGLLSLTRFQTPNAWDHFYQKEALGVKTWDLFDMVAGAFGGTLEQLLAVGGGGEEMAPEGSKRADRFPPMVHFLGPFTLAAKENKTHPIDIPQYIGAVRVMVVGGQEGAFGSADKTVFVRKPLMILGTLPRLLSLEETVTLPVTVFALEDKIRQVSVRIRTEGQISVSGNPQKSLEFTNPGDKMVEFTLKTNSRPGIARVYLESESGTEKNTQKIEIEVRSPSFPVVDVVGAALDPGKEWVTPVSLPGIAGTNTVSLEVSRIPPLNLGRRLTFLIQYPYGCVEQITSAVFPQIYLNDLLDLPPERRKQVEENVKAAIERLRNFQAPDGGFSYWPGDPGEDYISTYVGHFLVEAKTAGYTLPYGMLDAWQRYQRNQSLSWVTGPVRSELNQAYRLYTLALAGSPELGAMNRLRETPGIFDVVKWRLAAAYQLAGQPEAARDLAEKAGFDFREYRELANTYGSDLRDKAMVLEALVLLSDTRKALPLLQEISRELAGDKWLSTQSTAYSLIAIARYAGISGDRRESQFAFTWNDNSETSVAFSSPVYVRELITGNLTEGKIMLYNQSPTILYPRLIMEGIPSYGKEKLAQNGLTLTVRYFTLDIQPLRSDSLEQGTDFITELTVTHSGTMGKYEELALTRIFPSGWEIRNQRLDPSAMIKNPEFDYQDIRDDRIYTFFDLDQGQAKTFRFILNASYLGTFYLPMVVVEAMYDATINARVAGQWVKVIKPGVNR